MKEKLLTKSIAIEDEVGAEMTFLLHGMLDWEEERHRFQVESAVISQGRVLILHPGAKTWDVRSTSRHKAPVMECVGCVEFEEIPF